MLYKEVQHEQTNSTKGGKTMKHKTRLIGFLAVCLSVFWFAGTAVAAEKPNILIIWGDDIGQFNVSAYNLGMMGYKSPTLTASPRKGRCSLTGTASRVARPVAPHS